MPASPILWRNTSRDVIAALRGADLIATGPRSPQPGAPHTYVTTPAFLTLWGLASLGDLPDLDRLEDAGLLGKAPLPEELRGALGITGDDDDEDRAASAADDDGEADGDHAGLRWAEEFPQAKPAPEAVIEPSGKASAAATLSRSGAFRPMVP